MWEKKLYELGISEKELPSAVKTKIKQYRTLSDGINELEDKINNATEDDDVSEINTDGFLGKDLLIIYYTTIFINKLVRQ